MKEFFTSLYILSIDVLIFFAGYAVIEWLVSISTDGSPRMLYLFVLFGITLNSIYLITKLIENEK